MIWYRGTCRELHRTGLTAAGIRICSSTYRQKSPANSASRIFIGNAPTWSVAAGPGVTQPSEQKPAAPRENQEPSWELGHVREASLRGGDGRRGRGPISWCPSFLLAGAPAGAGLRSELGGVQRCRGVRLQQERGYWRRLGLQRRDFLCSKKIKVMEEDLIWQEGCY